MLARLIATVAALLLACANPQASAHVRAERMADLVDRTEHSATAHPGELARNLKTAPPARARPADLAPGKNVALTHCHVWQKSLPGRNRASARTVYTWDAEGRLAGAILGNGAAEKTIAYRYDPNGIRRSQQMTEASGAVTRTEYLVDPNQAYAQVLEEWTASAPSGPLPDETLTTTYVYGDDLISQTKLALAGTSATSIYHYDGLGTTRALSAHKVDAAGAPQVGHGEITDRYAYTAFGENDPAGTSGDTSGSTENNYRYTGEQLDPNLGFYYLRARYVDPRQGRFFSADKTHGVPSNSISLHKYLYGNQNPLIYVDPTGDVGIISVFANTVNSSLIRVGGVSGATTGAAKMVAEFAFEYATGIPVLTSPRNMLRAVRSLKDSIGDLANSFWLKKFRGGTNFENNVAEVWKLTKNTTCYKNGVPSSPPGCFIPDFYVNKSGRFIEVKSSVGAVSKDQFQEFIKISQRNGEPLAMVFLQPPSASDIAKLQRWAVEVVPGATDELLIKIVHVLE